MWREEFLDTMAQLEKQTRQQRVDELNGRIRESGLASLTPAEKDELRELQAHAPA